MSRPTVARKSSTRSSSGRSSKLLTHLREHAQRAYPEALIALEIAASPANLYVRIGLRWPEAHAHHAQHAVVILDLTDRWEAVDSDGWRKQLSSTRAGGAATTSLNGGGGSGAAMTASTWTVGSGSGLWFDMPGA